jgi:hypothetical protein
MSGNTRPATACELRAREEQEARGEFERELCTVCDSLPVTRCLLVSGLLVWEEEEKEEKE